MDFNEFTRWKGTFFIKLLNIYAIWPKPFSLNKKKEYL